MVSGTQRRDSSRTATALCLPSRSSGTLTSLATSLTASSSRRSSRPLTNSTASSTQSGPTNAYVCGNTMTSMDAARSSSVTMAQAPPALVTLRCTAVTRPPTVSTEPSARSSACSDEMGASTFAARMCSMPFSGWSDTYSPSISRS